VAKTKEKVVSNAPSAAQVEIDNRPGWQKWGSLAVLSLALAIIIIDTTLLNVSLKTIIVDLGTNIQGLQWVISAYALTLAALTITGGRLGDLFGRKKMFMIGAVLFAVGSLVASFANGLPMLLIGESIIEGVGAALMMPATASLLISTFRGRERAIAFGVWGAIAGAASAIGPILGGFLTSHYSWRWGFRINVFVVLVLLLASPLIKEARDRIEKVELDVVGILLSSVGLLAIVFGIIQSSAYGWFKTKQIFSIFGYIPSRSISITALSLVLGAILLGLFVWWERRHEAAGHTPLVSMKLFRNTQFISGASTMAMMSLGMTGLIFVVPVFLQTTLNLDAFHTGLALLPLSVAVLIVGPISAVLSQRITPKYLIQAGVGIATIAMLVIRSEITTTATAASLAPGLALFGVGMGLVMATVSNLTLSAVSVQQAGEASGVNNTMRQIGSSLGSAILGAVLLTALATNVSTGIKNSPSIPAQAKTTIAAAAGSHSSDAAFGGASGISHASPAIAAEIKTISVQATVDASQTTMLYGAGFLLLAFLISLKLPKTSQGRNIPKAAH
jgi:EmrB/QacA subfamily drug resistance transporter